VASNPRNKANKRVCPARESPASALQAMAVKKMETRGKKGNKNIIKI